MTATLDAPTQSMDANSNFESLHQQLKDDRSNAIQKQNASKVDVGEQAGDGEGMAGGDTVNQKSSGEKKEGKKIRFSKGEQIWDIDEDAIAEIKADKAIKNLSAREMRDKASGEIAIENRMREVAERKKDQDAFLAKFNKTAKTDPIKALEQMIEYASTTDPELNFNSYVNALIKQSEALGQMSDAEKKAWDLNRKLVEKEQIIKDKEDSENFDTLREDFVSEAGISTNEFDRMAQVILDDPHMSKDVKSTEDLFKVVEEFHFEVQAQNVAYGALSRVSRGIDRVDPLVFDLADVLKQNPDFTQQDVLDIAKEIYSGADRENAAKTLSRKQRNTVSTENYKTENLTPFEFLMQEFEKDREKNN